MDRHSVGVSEGVADMEYQVLSAVQSIVSFISASEAANRELLAKGNRNSSSTFWYTSWLIIVVLGLFSVYFLGKVHQKLLELVTYQAYFADMWNEDREEARLRREEKRQRDIESRRTAPTFRDLPGAAQHEHERRQQNQEGEGYDREARYDYREDDLDSEEEESIDGFLQNPLLREGGQPFGTRLPADQRAAIMEQARRILQDDDEY